MAEFAWKSPLAGIMTAAGDPDSPLLLAEVRRSLVSLVPRAGRRAEVSAALHDLCGLALPEPGRFNESGGIACLWTGIDSWMLAGSEAGDGPLFADLVAAMTGLAAVVNQGDGRCILRLSGAPSREVLARLCPVDTHPREFGPGHCAATRIGHVGAHLSQLDAVPSFEIQAFRAFAADVLHEIVEAAAEFSIRTVPLGNP